MGQELTDHITISRYPTFAAIQKIGKVCSLQPFAADHMKVRIGPVSHATNKCRSVIFLGEDKFSRLCAGNPKSW